MTECRHIYIPEAKTSNGSKSLRKLALFALARRDIFLIDGFSRRRVYINPSSILVRDARLFSPQPPPGAFFFNATARVISFRDRRVY